MFSSAEEIYLTRLIAKNQVVLFLGSGFSREAKNALNENFPTGTQLGEKLWVFLEYEGEYDNSALTEMFQAFVTAGKKNQSKIEFLNSNLLSTNIPDSYNAITGPFWYKIYTLNIDDVISKTFRRVGKGIEELIYPRDQYSERDQTLENTQIIYLHGKLPCDPKDVIFATKQYAKAGLTNQPLYGQFVYDYAVLPTIFIGTDLNEPLFETYIAARESKYDLPELRPKSFLISPSLSAVKASNLRNTYNVHHITGTTIEFLKWLESIKSQLPDRISILKSIFPNLLDLYNYADITGISKKSLNEFAKSFNRVPREATHSKERSGFLSGTSPRWNDIFTELDIPRTMTSQIYQVVEAAFQASTLERIQVIKLSGYAGSGKSTILKRLGFMLSQHGRTGFLTYSSYMPKVDDIVNVLNGISERVFLIFDNANDIINQLSTLIQKLNSDLITPPIVILGVRSNYINKVDEVLDNEIASITSFKIPDLDDTEINNLISKLDETNMLGILKGKSKKERFNEFKIRANSQILIAMKETTKGLPFGAIMRGEFDSLEPDEVKRLCMCISLCSEHNYPNSRQDFIGFSKIDHNEALNYLKTVLHGTIIWVNNGNNFLLRHRILADYFIKNCASQEILKDAYVRVLSVLAPELLSSAGTSKEAKLFRALINHKTLYWRFSSDINRAREVFESITKHFSNDPHFWLQYGSLEIEGKGGDLKLAENYIDQAESLFPTSRLVQNAKCNLLYKLSASDISYHDAMVYKDKADEMAGMLLLTTGKEDFYIYHVYCTGRYNFASKWITNLDEKKVELEELKKVVRTAITFHPNNSRLQFALTAIDRAYANLGIKGQVQDPQIPGFLNN